jgi:uncharacterized protein
MFRLFTWLAATLTLIGALNWWLVGLFRFNLVQTLFGQFSRTIYALVGISGLFFSFALTRANNGHMINPK